CASGRTPSARGPREPRFSIVETRTSCTAEHARTKPCSSGLRPAGTSRDGKTFCLGPPSNIADSPMTFRDADPRPAWSRRNFLKPRVAPGWPVPSGGRRGAAARGPPADPRQPFNVNLHVNGRRHAMALDVRTTLLDALREHLGLTGSKKGCDHGQCGA